MLGSATLRIVLSREIVSSATERTTKVHQRRSYAFVLLHGSLLGLDTKPYRFVMWEHRSTIVEKTQR